MSSQQYHQALALSNANQRLLDGYIRGLGSRQNPTTGLQEIYDRYRPLLLSITDTATRQVLLNRMRQEVQTLVQTLVQQAINTAQVYFTQLGSIYGETFIARYNATSVLQAAQATVDQQFDTILKMLLTGVAIDAVLFGSDNRVGLLSPGFVSRNSAYLLGSIFNNYGPLNPNLDDDYFKQAIATLDFRTTECCREVHLQVQPFDKPFILVGTPHYDSRMDWSPFHDWCRTTIVLVHREDIP